MGLLDRFTKPYAQTDTPLNLRLMLAMNALGSLSGSPTFARNAQDSTPSIMALIGQGQERFAKTKAQEKADRLRKEYAQKLRDAGKFEAASAIESGLVEAGDIIKLDYEAIQREKDRVANREDKQSDRDAQLENDLTKMRYADQYKIAEEERSPTNKFLKTLIPPVGMGDTPNLPLPGQADGPPTPGGKLPIELEPGARGAKGQPHFIEPGTVPEGTVDPMTANIRRIFKDPELTPADAFSISLHAQTSPEAAAKEAARIKSERKKIEYDASDIVVINDRPYNKRTNTWLDLPGSENATGLMFDSKSVEGQALNWLVANKRLTPEQAANVAAGKVVIDPVTRQPMFLTPDELVGAAVAAGMPPPPASTTGDTDAVLEQAPTAAGVDTRPGSAVVPPASAPAPSASIVPQIPGRKGVPLTQVAPRPFTEDVRRGTSLFAGLTKSIEDAEKHFDSLADIWAQLGANMGTHTDSIPQEILGQAGRYLLLDDNAKLAADAVGQIAQNYTYAASGAAAPDGEKRANLNKILPSVGDGPVIMAAKKQRVKDYLWAIELRSYAEKIGEITDPNAKFNPNEFAEKHGIEPGSTVPATAKDAGVDQETWDVMSPEEKALFK